MRAAIAGLRFGARRPLLSSEFNALAVWRAAEVRLLLQSTSVLWPGPYTRHWRRRLRETTGLTSEDAMILALGTFGATASGDILGMPLVVTADLPLLNGYHKHVEKLRRRLRAMTAHLQPPFDQAALPRLVAPETLIAEWA